MTFTHQPKLDRMADTLGDLIARVPGRSDVDYSVYRDDRLGFVRDVFPGVKLWHRQEEMLVAMDEGNRVCAFGANSTGKDFAAGIAGCHWIATRPGGRVIYTSSKETQVIETCFRSNLIPRIRDAGLPAECYTQAIRMGGETVALGMTSNMASRLTGYHAEGGVLLVLSECQGLDELAWEAAYAVATSELDCILAIGNPIAPIGSFYRASRSPHWTAVKLSALEHPNVVHRLRPGDEDFIPAGPGAAWCEEMKTTFTPPLYQARVLGQFPTESMHGLVTMAWLEEAQRKHESGELKAPPTQEAVIGCDIARFGADATCLAIRRGQHLEELVRWYATDIVETSDRIATEAARYGVTPQVDLGSKGTLQPRGALLVDEAGLGAGCADLVKARGFRTYGFNSSRKARNDKRYYNARAEAYAGLAEQLRDGLVALPYDEELWAELLGTSYELDGQGRIKIESKDDISARLARSPDKGDSVAMSFYAGASRSTELFTFRI